MDTQVSRDGDLGPLSREAYALLAQANLMRMRGQWQEAIDNCLAALRLAPEHPTAQSLLGDIYENQGRIDDAIQWYRMALDVQADSPANQMKLDRLLKLKSAAAAAPYAGAYPEAQVTGPIASDMAGVPAIMRTNPERFMRWATAIAVLVVVLLIGAAVLVTRWSMNSQNQGSTTVKPYSVNPPQQPTPAPPPAAAAPVRDPLDQALMTALQNQPDLAAQGLAITDVQTDPRSQHLTVTAAWTQPTPGSNDQAGLSKASASILEVVAAQESRQSAAYTVRLFTGSPTSPAGGTLAFVGDAQRSAIIGLGEISQAAPSTIAAAFTNVWTPQEQTPPGSGTTAAGN